MIHFTTFLFQLQALAGEIAVAEVDDVPTEGAEGAELAAAGLVGGAVPLEEGGGVAGGEEADELAGVVGAGEGAGAGGGEFAGLGEEFVGGLPAGEAMGAPFGEILLGDGAAVKFAGEKGPDGGERVEPGEERGAGFGVGEAAVEGFAEGAGQAGDFSGRHRRLSSFSILAMVSGEMPRSALGKSSSWMSGRLSQRRNSFSSRASDLCWWMASSARAMAT